MVMVTRKTVLLGKIETTYGTDSVPTGAANAILAMDVLVKENAGIVERGAQWKYLGQPPSLLGDRWADVSFKVQVYGSGAAGTAPRVGALLRACGFAEVVVSSTSVTYTPNSSNHDSVTLYIYKDGRLHTITGCRGTVKTVYSAGQALTMDFSFQGKYSDPTVAALPGTVTYESTFKLPPVCKSSLFAYNNKTTLVVGTLELDVANEVVKRVSLSDSNAVAGFEITSRNPIFTMDPEAQFETSYNFRADWATTQRSISVVATRAAGNIVTATIPNANITKIEYGDRDGIDVEKIEGNCSESSGDDSFSLAFT
jgi:hypothetical protein